MQGPYCEWLVTGESDSQAVLSLLLDFCVITVITPDLGVSTNLLQNLKYKKDKYGSDKFRVELRPLYTTITQQIVTEKALF
jgi:hypothetical protein